MSVVFEDNKIRNGIHALIHVCANLQSNERVYIISDLRTSQIAEFLFEEISKFSAFVSHDVVASAEMHGKEPPKEVAQKMLNADVIFGLTRMSMAHTNARHAASCNGARYLSLPDYSWEVLASPALTANFRGITSLADQFADLLTVGKRIRLETKIGTMLELNIEGRVANSAPGWCFAPGSLASPPDAEVNIAPIEADTNGIAVIDGSIPCDSFGLLSSPITLRIKNGSVVSIDGKDAHKLQVLFDQVGNHKSKIIGEFGIGLNPLAVLTGAMLEDEGCFGTVHLGIGANHTIGGKNKVPFHLDHIIRSPTIYVDNKIIIREGVLA